MNPYVEEFMIYCNAELKKSIQSYFGKKILFNDANSKEMALSKKSYEIFIKFSRSGYQGKASIRVNNNEIFFDIPKTELEMMNLLDVYKSIVSCLMGKMCEIFRKLKRSTLADELRLLTLKIKNQGMVLYQKQSEEPRLKAFKTIKEEFCGLVEKNNIYLLIGKSKICLELLSKAQKFEEGSYTEISEKVALLKKKLTDYLLTVNIAVKNNEDTLGKKSQEIIATLRKHSESIYLDCVPYVICNSMYKNKEYDEGKMSVNPDMLFTKHILKGAIITLHKINEPKSFYNEFFNTLLEVKFLNRRQNSDILQEQNDFEVKSENDAQDQLEFLNGIDNADIDFIISSSAEFINQNINKNNLQLLFETYVEELRKYYNDNPDKVTSANLKALDIKEKEDKNILIFAYINNLITIYEGRKSLDPNDSTLNLNNFQVVINAAMNALEVDVECMKSVVSDKDYKLSIQKRIQDLKTLAATLTSNYNETHQGVIANIDEINTKISTSFGKINIIKEQIHSFNQSINQVKIGIQNITSKLQTAIQEEVSKVCILEQTQKAAVTIGDSSMMSCKLSPTLNVDIQASSNYNLTMWLRATLNLRYIHKDPVATRKRIIRLVYIQHVFDQIMMSANTHYSSMSNRTVMNIFFNNIQKAEEELKTNTGILSKFNEKSSAMDFLYAFYLVQMLYDENNKEIRDIHSVLEKAFFETFKQLYSTDKEYRENFLKDFKKQIEIAKQSPEISFWDIRKNKNLTVCQYVKTTFKRDGELTYVNGKSFPIYRKAVMAGMAAGIRKNFAAEAYVGLDNALRKHKSKEVDVFLTSLVAAVTSLSLGTVIKPNLQNTVVAPCKAAFIALALQKVYAIVYNNTILKNNRLAAISDWVQVYGANN